MTQAAPSSVRWDVERLLDPVRPESFLLEYWQRSSLHLTRKIRGYYADLLTRADVEGLLDIEDFYSVASVQTPSSGDTTAAHPPRSLADVQRELAGGASLRIRHLEAWFGPQTPLGGLIRNMEAWLDSTLESVSSYFALVTSAGLGPHHDETEIFTLQVEGRKRWTFFGMGDPSAPARYVPDTLPAPVHELVLQPGDLLYMPRGFIHEVKTVEDSFSLTLVFQS